MDQAIAGGWGRGVIGMADRASPRKVDLFGLFTALVVLLVLALIAFPIGRMILRAFSVDGAPSLAIVRDVLSQTWLPDVALNTVTVVAASTVVSLVVGSMLAWLNERTDANLGLAGYILPILPFLMPSVAMAIGWALIGAPRVGFLNGLIAMIPFIGADGLRFSVNIYSWSGLIWIYTLHGVPLVYMVVAVALRNLDPSLEEASLMEGASLLRTLRKVSFPVVKPALLSASLLTAISGFALYSLPAIIATPARIDILSVHTVRLLRNTYPPRLDQAIVLGLMTLVIVGSIWAFQRWIASGSRSIAIGGRAAGARRLSLGAWRIPARILMAGYLVCASLVPLAALIVVALHPFWSPRILPALMTLDNFRTILFVNRLTSDAFWNSLHLALAGATIATCAALVVAVHTVRHKTWFARMADGLVKAPSTISALVISIGFLITFAGPPFRLGGSLLILELAFLIIYLPSASIAVDASVSQIGNDLWEASQISGAGDGRTVRKVVFPLALLGLAGAWSIVFVHIMGDLSASALLAGVGSPVIGYAILEVWENGGFSLLAAYSTLMCGAITAVVGVVIALARWRQRHL